MLDEQAPNDPDTAVREVAAADRRALAELLCRPVTGWGLANLEAHQNTVGPMVHRQVLQETVQAVLAAVLAAVVAAGWRPPTPAGDRRRLGGPTDQDAPALFAAEPTADSAGISTVGSGPPGRPR